MKIVGIIVLAVIWILFGLFMIGLLLDETSDQIDPILILFAIFWPLIIVAEILFIVIPKIVLGSVHIGNYVRRWLINYLRLEE